MSTSFDPPDEEVIRSMIAGRKMPTEKVVAWLLRIIIALGLLYVATMYNRLETKADRAVSAQAQHDAWAAAQAQVHTKDFAEAERRVMALEVMNPEVLRRLDGIEAQLTDLNKYLRERSGR